MTELSSGSLMKSDGIPSKFDTEHKILLIRAHLKNGDGMLVWRGRPKGLSSQNKSSYEAVVTSSCFMLIHHGEAIDVHAGEWNIELLPLSRIAKLFAFIDAAGIVQSGNEKYHLPDTEPQFIFPTESAKSDDKIETQIVNAVLCHDQSLNMLWAAIRAHESYWINSHLLSEMSEGNRVEDMRSQYGVSSSHFRRLCKQHLGINAKGQLRAWRVCIAVLQIIESNQSLSNIAANNGYASASHFAKDVKSFFGFTPSEFRSLEWLLYEKKSV